MFRNGLLDGIEELPEFRAAMPAMAFADDLSGFHIEGGEQGCRPVTRIVVSTPFQLSRSHWEQRLRAVQSLDLRLLVHAEHKSAVRRVQIQPHDIAHLLDEQWVFR